MDYYSNQESRIVALSRDFSSNPIPFFSILAELNPVEEYIKEHYHE